MVPIELPHSLNHILLFRKLQLLTFLHRVRLTSICLFVGPQSLNSMIGQHPGGPGAATGVPPSVHPGGAGNAPPTQQQLITGGGGPPNPAQQPNTGAAAAAGAPPAAAAQQQQIPNLAAPATTPGLSLPHHVMKAKKPRANAVKIIDPNTHEEVQAYDDKKKTETKRVVMTDPADQQKEVKKETTRKSFFVTCSDAVVLTSVHCLR